jgi:hypothetical protein
MKYATFDLIDGSEIKLLKHKKRYYKDDHNLILCVQQLRDTLTQHNIKPSNHNMMRLGISLKSIYIYKRHCSKKHDSSQNKYDAYNYQ